MNSQIPHVPVLLQPVLDWLDPDPGKSYADLTLGAGGHSLAIAQHLIGSPSQPAGQLWGLDQDPQILAMAQQRLQSQITGPYAPQLTFGQSNFEHAATWLSQYNALPLTGGLLADLGVSSLQLDDGSRGFSWRTDAPLDMRMNATSQPNDVMATLTAAQVVNTWNEAQLTEIFTIYGEARLAKSIAKAIVSHRAQQLIQTTTQLAQLVVSVYQRHIPGFSLDKSRIHPATQVFQALRIAVNRELDVLEALLLQLPTLLAPGARAVLISFHSLEDRMVKRAFQHYRQQGQCQILTPKPITASPQELATNPRARSAKLRAAQWL
jgi:16S rRNA (cytosine1402-N4)-methyltransferase